MRWLLLWQAPPPATTAAGMFISQEALMLRKIQVPVRTHAKASASRDIGFWPDFVGNWPDPMHAERSRKLC